MVNNFFKNISAWFAVEAKISPGKKMREGLQLKIQQKIGVRDLEYGVHLYLSYGEYVICTAILPLPISIFLFQGLFKLWPEILPKDGLCILLLRENCWGKIKGRQEAIGVEQPVKYLVKEKFWRPLNVMLTLLIGNTDCLKHIESLFLPGLFQTS